MPNLCPKPFWAVLLTSICKSTAPPAATSAAAASASATGTAIGTSTATAAAGTTSTTTSTSTTTTSSVSHLLFQPVHATSEDFLQSASAAEGFGGQGLGLRVYRGFGFRV